MLLRAAPQEQGQLSSLAERAALQREEELPSQELEEEQLFSGSSEGNRQEESKKSASEERGDGSGDVHQTHADLPP